MKGICLSYDVPGLSGEDGRYRRVASSPGSGRGRVGKMLAALLEPPVRQVKGRAGFRIGRDVRLVRWIGRQREREHLLKMI